jgi:hypothetical protein
LLTGTMTTSTPLATRRWAVHVGQHGHHHSARRFRAHAVHVAGPGPPRHRSSFAACWSGGTTTTPPVVPSSPTSAPATTTAPQPLVVASEGGSIAVRCANDGALTIVWAAPKADYTYVPEEIGSTHIHVGFVSSERHSEIEVQCQGSSPVVNVEDGD